MSHIIKTAMVAALLLGGVPTATAQPPAVEELSERVGSVAPVFGTAWRLEIEAGRGYESNVRPAPPSPPPASPVPPDSPPPAVTSPGNDHFNTLRLGAIWHYRSPLSSPDALRVDWPTRLQAMLTRYDNFADSNRDEFTIDSLPGWIYGDNETRLFARFMKMAMGGADFVQEYSLRPLQIKMLRPPYGIAFGIDIWEQQFDLEPISSRHDHRRNRLVGGVVGHFSQRSRLMLLAATGRDEGLHDRDDFDVRGVELNLHTELADRLTLRLLAEYEEGDSVQTPGMTLERRKVDLRAHYQVHPSWRLGFGYKLDGFASGDFSLPDSKCLEATLGLVL